MPKKSWNKFSEEHKKSIAFAAGVSAALPKGLIFDKNRKKLPTPYGLLLEWASANLTGDWASSKLPGGCALVVATEEDAKKVVKIFGTIGQAKSTDISANTVTLNFRDENYGPLAKALGYAL